jgi:hypothetical protein
MIHLLLFKYGGGQDYAFPPLLDSRAQKKRAQVLLHRTWTDAEFRCDLFIAAALDKQSKNLLVSARNFDLIEVQHFFPFLFAKMPTPFIEARPSPNLRHNERPTKSKQMQHLRIPTVA